MNEAQPIIPARAGFLLSANRRIAVVAASVLALDQLTKQVVKRLLPQNDEWVVIRGFFKFVHWNNTGAAWSLFEGQNVVLAAVGMVALLVLFRNRRHFDAHTKMGQLALGLIFGGIVGNLLDRLIDGHVTDFLYFYLERRGDPRPVDFPAFNVADSAICIGVGLIFLASFRNERPLATAPPGNA